jgi:D-tyrosyl-tRNA(Tyr) deacylase
MIAVVQRCLRGEVRVGGERVGALPPAGGLVVLLGIEVGDGAREASRMADKLAKLRIFEDAAGRMNRCVAETGGGVLVVSQFTLAGDTRGGNRPSFTNAARPELAEPLVANVVDALRATGLAVETGRFRTEMEVDLVNDGPVTLVVRIDPPASGS